MRCCVSRRWHASCSAAICKRPLSSQYVANRDLVAGFCRFEVPGLATIAGEHKPPNTQLALLKQAEGTPLLSESQREEGTRYFLFAFFARGGILEHGCCFVNR